MKVLYQNAGWIATPERFSSRSIYNIRLLDADAIMVENGIIRQVGKKNDFTAEPIDQRVDLQGMGVTPGLIDFHTHPVFAATREEEFELRTMGASYTEIAESGGGILNSAKKLRVAEKNELIDHASKFLNNALRHGTTTMEAKSGYGLEPEAEYKMLRSIRTLNEIHPLDLVPTFLGAHEYPAEYKQDHEGYIKLLTEKMIPYVAAQKLAQACDIFCETGVFSLEESRRILTVAKEHGLKIKVHADQLTPLGGTKLAAELGALSADHIEFIDEEAIQALREAGTVAGLLPVAAHFLRMKEDPPVRKMIDSGVVCALATDFNPGSAMCESMQMAIHLAVIRFRITAEEALWMATAGSARALGLVDRGWIGEEALADFVVWNTNSVKKIPYHFGINHVNKVVKAGKIVVDDGRLVK